MIANVNVLNFEMLLDNLKGQVSNYLKKIPHHEYYQTNLNEN